jgi:hypothetical protein
MFRCKKRSIVWDNKEKARLSVNTKVWFSSYDIDSQRHYGDFENNTIDWKASVV